MTAPITKRQAASNHTSQIVVRQVSASAGSQTTEPNPPPPSRLPTFVRGRVLAEHLLVDQVFEVTPHGTFLRAHDLERDQVVLVRLRPRRERSAPDRGHVGGWFQRIDHPLSSAAVLGTLGVGVLNGSWPLLVSQYWRGRSLEAFLRSGEAPDLLFVLRLARQLALALDGAHRLGQAHGELRSDDVWLSRNADGQERPMLLGFQPRESIDGSAALVARDLTAFGDLLSLMVASLLPRYRSATREATLGKHAQDSAALLVTIGPLTRVAAACQEASSAGQYRSVAEAATALARVEAIAWALRR